ncbi:MAG: hypothetical protein JWO95_2132 [Verrucomicrobiales bacterium]|nr:hypothetical protein [Verrucomicrobiales bacterium]
MKWKKKLWVSILIFAIVSTVGFILSPASVADAEVAAGLFKYYCRASTNGWGFVASDIKIPGGYGKKPALLYAQRNDVVVRYKWAIGKFLLVHYCRMYRDHDADPVWSLTTLWWFGGTNAQVVSTQSQASQGNFFSTTQTRYVCLLLTPRIDLEQLKIFTGELADFRREVVVVPPESWRGVAVHGSGLQRPAR